MTASVDIVATKMEKILEEKCNLEWNVNIDNMITPIRTSVFTINDGVDFYFEVWFQIINHGCSNESSLLKVVLRKLSGSSVNPDLCLHIHVSVYYANGKLYTENRSVNPITLHKFSPKSCINHVYSTISTTHGENLKTKKLVLKCQMNTYGHLLSPKSYYSETSALVTLRSLTKNFEALYESSEFSDVDIQVGEKAFKSHKFVLAAHSPVFKTMLLQDFKEAKTGVITISDIEPEIFECFLKFLYKGQVEEKTFSNFKELYSLADKYDVQALKQECVQMLTEFSINDDQIEDIFQLAYLCNDDILKKVAKKLLLSTSKKEF